MLPSRFQLVREVKAGAFGAVWLADDSLYGQQVALKFISRCQAKTKEAAAFLEAEVLHHLQLRHPHVITLQEVVLTDSHLVLVLDYAAGGDLSGYVPAGRGLGEEQCRWLFQQLAFALEYCHRMGVASRDVKLENCLVDCPNTQRPILRLADFGLSAPCGPGAPLCRGIVGTPAYLAPEVLASAAPGGQAYDPRKADVFAAGVLLYMLLLGVSPFQRTADAVLPSSRHRMRALLGRITRGDWARPPPGRLSAAADDLLAAMLHPNPAARPDMSAVLDHPWCSEGLTLGELQRCNDTFVARSAAVAPPPELLAELQQLLAEAGRPQKPLAAAATAAAAMGCNPKRAPSLAAPATPSVHEGPKAGNSSASASAALSASCLFSASSGACVPAPDGAVEGSSGGAPSAAPPRRRRWLRLGAA